MANSNSGPVKLLWGAGNLAKCGQQDIRHTEWRLDKYTHNYRYNYTCVFSIHNVLCT